MPLRVLPYAGTIPGNPYDGESPTWDLLLMPPLLYPLPHWGRGKGEGKRSSIVREAERKDFFS